MLVPHTSAAAPHDIVMNMSLLLAALVLIISSYYTMYTYYGGELNTFCVDYFHFNIMASLYAAAAVVILEESSCRYRFLKHLNIDVGNK